MQLWEEEIDWDTGQWADVKARIKIRVCKEIKNSNEEYKKDNEESEENTLKSKQLYPRYVPVISWQVLNNFVEWVYLPFKRTWAIGRQRKKDLKEPI